jgi:membrane-bound transcription factor site-1 protease
LQNYTPRASLVPGELNFEFQKSCPYAWPHCTAPLYAGAMPFIFNATIVNGMGLGGWVSGLPRFIPTEDDPKVRIVFPKSLRLFAYTRLTLFV